MNFNEPNFVNMWGEGYPYSIVHLDREIAIHGDYQASDWLYLRILVNPLTYRTIRRKKESITNEFIQKFLKEAKANPELENGSGYEYVERYHISESRYAEERLEEVRVAVIEMQKIVMEEYNLEWEELPAELPEELES